LRGIQEFARPQPSQAQEYKIFNSFERFTFEKKAPVHTTYTMLPRKFYPQDAFYYAHPFRLTETVEAMVQVSLSTAKASDRVWHLPVDTGFAGMK
jgi:hypothetical protein